MRCILTIIFFILILFTQGVAGNQGLSQHFYQIKQKKLPEPEPLPSFLESPVLEKTATQLRINHLFLPAVAAKRSAGSQVGLTDVLSIYPLKKLRFVGLLTDKNMRWALIILPNQQVIYAKEGDRIGTDGAQIKIIEEQKLILSSSCAGSKRALNNEMNVPISSDHLES